MAKAPIGKEVSLVVGKRNAKGPTAGLMAAIVLRKGKKVLLAKTKGWDGGTWWFLPIDSLRYGEAAEGAVKRISKEWFRGAKLPVKLTQFQNHLYEGTHWYPIAVFEGKAPARVRTDKDIVEVGFFDPAKPPKPLGMDARSILKEWRKRK